MSEARIVTASSDERSRSQLDRVTGALPFVFNSAQPAPLHDRRDWVRVENRVDALDDILSVTGIDQGKPLARRSVWTTE